MRPKITSASSWLLHIAAVIDCEAFRNCQLRGNFLIVELGIAHEPLLDPIGRQAIAQTAIIGHEFHISLRSGLSDEEVSVTLYHEISHERMAPEQPSSTEQGRQCQRAALSGRLPRPADPGEAAAAPRQPRLRSALVVLVVAAPPDALLVAPLGCAVEPLVH